MRKPSWIAAPVAALAALALACGPVAAPVHRQLVERTGGNPLALLELPDALTPEQQRDVVTRTFTQSL